MIKEWINKYGLSPRYGGKIKYEPKTAKISRRKARSEALPGAIQVGKEKPRVAKKAVVEPSEIARRKPTERKAKPRERPSARVGKGLSKAEQVETNKKIEALVKKKGDNYIDYSEEEKELLRQYTGAGGLEKGGAEGKGLLDEYYTPKPIVDFMWDRVKRLFGQFQYDTSILEPSAGIGRFLEPLEDKRNVAAWEINPISSTITKVLFPNVMTVNKPFENNFIDDRGRPMETWRSQNDIVIGNPPYGEHRGRFLGLGEESKITKYEEYFLKRGLDTLDKNGLLAYVMPSNFLRGSIDYAKKEIGKMARLEEAYRLPNGVFGTTDIGTDILIFRKGGKTDPVFLSDDNYFDNYPKRVLGKILKGKGNYGVDLVEGTLEEALKKAGLKTEEKEMEVQKEPVKQDKDLVPPEPEVAETRTEAPKTVVNAINKKAFIIPNKKDTTIKLSDVSAEENELWSNIEVTGELNLEYIKKQFPNIDKLKEFKSNKIAVEPGVNNKFYPNVLYCSGNIYEKLDNLEAR